MFDSGVRLRACKLQDMASEHQRSVDCRRLSNVLGSRKLPIELSHGLSKSGSLAAVVLALTYVIYVIEAVCVVVSVS